MYVISHIELVLLVINVHDMEMYFHYTCASTFF